MTRAERWLRAPLLRFVAGGTALFGLVHQWRPPVAPVVVTAHDVERLRLDYTRETGLDARPADEAALVDKMIEEELLFREAVARGLDRNDRSVRNWLVEQMRVVSDDAGDDPDRLYAQARLLGLDRTDLVVRRILVQKMRLLAARSGEARPGDDELAAFYARHGEDYRTPDRLSFWHVFFASTAHGGAPGPSAAAAVARFAERRRLPADAVREGDPFPVPPHVVAQSPSQLERLFGAGFASALERVPTGSWSGAVPSPYGVHLVWVEARQPGAVPPLAAVRERLLERWQDEQRARRLADLVRALERRYPVRVESAAWRERSTS